MVAPAAADLQIARREPLATKAAAQRERERATVARLDVGLHTVQPQHLEGVAQREPDSLGHETLPGGAREGVVADEGTLQRAAHDLVQVDDADDRSVVTPADEEALAPRPARGSHEGAEGARVLRRMDPGTVQVPAAARQREELVAICRRRAAEHHPSADNEGTRSPRPHDSRPRSARVSALRGRPRTSSADPCSITRPSTSTIARPATRRAKA